MEDRPAKIKAQLFPYHDADINKLINALAGFVARYEVDGARYLEIINFKKHQHIHPDEKQSIIPQNQGIPGDLKTRSEIMPYSSSPSSSPSKQIKTKKRIAASPPSTPIPSPEKAPKPKEHTPIQLVIRYFKEAKYVHADDKDWDRKHWNGRLVREAKALLKAFDGNPTNAGRYMLIKGEEWKDLPDWGINGIIAAIVVGLLFRDRIDSNTIVTEYVIRFHFRDSL